MTEREIEVKKQVSKFFKTAEQRAKRDVCALCGKPCTSFANSHSVPQFVLKNIDVNGKFKHSEIYLEDQIREMALIMPGRFMCCVQIAKMYISRIMKVKELC